MANNSNSPKILNNQESDCVMYRECWRNHAVQIGGYAADGCGEFIPKSKIEGSKEALVCDACGCHRNFHRKEVVKNGVRVVGSHHLPPNPIWAHQRNNEVVEVCVSSDPFSCYYYKPEDVVSVSVSDEESVICSTSGSYQAQMETKPTKKL